MKDEPVRIVALIQAVVAAILAFVPGVTTTQAAAVMAVCLAAGAVVVRSQVTPVG